MATNFKASLGKAGETLDSIYLDSIESNELLKDVKQLLNRYNDLLQESPIDSESEKEEMALALAESAKNLIYPHTSLTQWLTTNPANVAHDQLQELTTSLEQPVAEEAAEEKAPEEQEVNQPITLAQAIASTLKTDDRTSVYAPLVQLVEKSHKQEDAEFLKKVMSPLLTPHTSLFFTTVASSALKQIDLLVTQRSEEKIKQLQEAQQEKINIVVSELSSSATNDSEALSIEKKANSQFSSQASSRRDSISDVDSTLEATHISSKKGVKIS